MATPGINATGHLFRAIPCVDAQGIPIQGDCNYNTTERSFLACATAGCHATVDAAASALTLATTRIQNDADDLLGQLTIVDPNLGSAGGEIDPSTPTFTVAEGAFSAPVVAAAARADGIDMPITDAVARLVAGEIRAGEAIQALLSRPLRPEGR